MEKTTKEIKTEKKENENPKDKEFLNPDYIADSFRQMAIRHAEELKDFLVRYLAETKSEAPEQWSLLDEAIRIENEENKNHKYYLTTLLAFLEIAPNVAAHDMVDLCGIDLSIYKNRLVSSFFGGTYFEIYEIESTGEPDQNGVDTKSEYLRYTCYSGDQARELQSLFLKNRDKNDITFVVKKKNTRTKGVL